jgi:3-hydroxyacyl-[acyl-carrier-protein] dehydratase
MSAGRLETSLHIPMDHPAFPGHFPGRPVVPAVVLLAEVLAAIEQATSRPPQAWMLQNAKFLAPVGPGAEVVIAHEPTVSGGRRFEIRHEGKLVATGQLA